MIKYMCESCGDLYRDLDHLGSEVHTCESIKYYPVRIWEGVLPDGTRKKYVKIVLAA